MGGPIYKDHTFFFASTQLLRSLSTTSGSATFEAPEFVQFAKTNFPNSIGTTLLSKYPIGHATFSSVSKTAQQVFGASCGTPAAANIPCSLPVIDAGSYSLAPYRNGTQYSIRVDQNFRHERVYASYYNSTLNTLTASVRSGMDLTNLQTSRSFQVSETHTFNAHMLNEAKFGYLPIEGIAGGAGPFSVPQINITGQSTAVGVGPARPGLHSSTTTIGAIPSASCSGGTTCAQALRAFTAMNSRSSASSSRSRSSPSTTFSDLAQDKPFSETGIYYNPVTGHKAFLQPRRGQHNLRHLCAGRVAGPYAA